MKLIIPDEPVCQIRMKYSGRNGIGRIYDPREKQKREIKSFIANKIGAGHCFSHPRISFVFHMPIPKSIPKKFVALYNSGLLKHEKKPDVDNFVKLYLDCMDGILFEGDQKVQLGPAVKLYHPHPKTIVLLNETTQILSPLEVDQMTWLFLFGQESGKCSYAEMDSLSDSYAPNQLRYSLSRGMTSLHQINDTLQPIPLAHEAMAEEALALGFSCHPDHLHGLNSHNLE